MQTVLEAVDVVHNAKDSQTDVPIGQDGRRVANKNDGVVNKTDSLYNFSIS